MKDVIQNKNSKIRMLDENIFYVCYHSDILIEVEDFQETSEVYENLRNGEQLRFLVEFPKHISGTAEARQWAEKNQVDCIAEAIVFNGLAQRLLIRMYLIFRVKSHPVKIFTDKESALIWLEQFK